MSSITTVSDITSPTEYTLLDNNHKYLSREFTFVPTVSSESDDNAITETVNNALNNKEYYECTPQDFICNIKVQDNLGKDVVYKTDNKSAYVYKIGSGESAAYKYCESSKVDINALGDANINIGNVTVKKDEDVLEPLAPSLDCTVPTNAKEITVPKDYDSLEINSSNVYFRKENSKIHPSWVIKNNNSVSFSNISINTQPDITFDKDTLSISKNQTTYSVDDKFISSLTKVKNKLIPEKRAKLTFAETSLNNAEENLNSAKDTLQDILYAEDGTPSDSLNSLVTLATTCEKFYKSITNANDLPELIQTLGKPSSNVSKIFNNFENAKELLKKPIEQNLIDASNCLRQVINTLNNLPAPKNEYYYFTDNNNDLVGLIISYTPTLQGFFIYEWLKELIEYCVSHDEVSEFNFLDNDKKMIICKTNNNLVYLENNGQNGDKILPDGDYFLTTEPTNP